MPNILTFRSGAEKSLNSRSFTNGMLRFFSPLSADDALKQHQQLLMQSAATASAAASSATLAAALRRGPGRPKKQLDAASVLATAADLADLASTAEDDEPQAKRGKYANWSVQSRSTCTLTLCWCSHVPRHCAVDAAAGSPLPISMTSLPRTSSTCAAPSTQSRTCSASTRSCPLSPHRASLD